MKILTKWLLALTLTGFSSGILFVTGVINPGDAVGWYMTLPAGAIFFGMFLICLMLQKEVELFDAEQKTHSVHAAAMEADRHSVYGARPAH